MSKDQVYQQNLPGDGEPNRLPNDCEDCRTPTSLDHKIPTIQTCPPAPRKHGLEFSRKRKFPKLQFFEIKGHEEIESFFGSSFEFSGVASRSVKKKTIQSVKFTYHTNNVLYANCALYLFEKGGPLPKFGEWDVNDPASAEGFTVIFNKARNEKKPESPTKEETAFKHGQLLESLSIDGGDESGREIDGGDDLGEIWRSEAEKAAMARRGQSGEAGRGDA
ncbi:Protein NOI4 [Camellia lanceoleosa]|uniref:Protein NOI4 n=1 Tax=Camellia lanceoleosa TaxID=1840588 RepID=A0ACC0F4W9_9ERIC|nr:Protein NOI4 [Camellia lanceoleosa]